MESQGAVLGGFHFAVRVSGADGLPGRVPDPVGRHAGLDRLPRFVEEIQGAARHVQLVHRVHDGAARVGPLGLADARRPLQRRRRRFERYVELAGHLVAHREEEAAAEEAEDQDEHAGVQEREPQAQPGEGRHDGSGPNR